MMCPAKSATRFTARSANRCPWRNASKCRGKSANKSRGKIAAKCLASRATPWLAKLAKRFPVNKNSNNVFHTFVRIFVNPSFVNVTSFTRHVIYEKYQKRAQDHQGVLSVNGLKTFFTGIQLCNYLNDTYFSPFFLVS